MYLPLLIQRLYLITCKLQCLTGITGYSSTHLSGPRLLTLLSVPVSTNVSVFLESTLSRVENLCHWVGRIRRVRHSFYFSVIVLNTCKRPRIEVSVYVLKTGTFRKERRQTIKNTTPIKWERKSTDVSRVSQVVQKRRYNRSNSCKHRTLRELPRYPVVQYPKHRSTNASTIEISKGLVTFLQ